MNQYVVLNSSNLVGDQLKIDETLNGKYELVLFSVTNSLYNVNESNNKIYLTYISGPPAAYEITLTNGNYTGPELIVHLSSLLTSTIVGSVWDNSFDSITGKFTFTQTAGGPDAFFFTFGDNTSNSARKLLGFEEQNSSSSSTVISTNVIDLSPLSLFFCRIDEGSNSVTGLNHFNSTFFLYDKTSEFGSTLRYVPTEGVRQLVKFNNERSITVKFYDFNYNEINFNGIKWIMLLKHLSS